MKLHRNDLEDLENPHISIHDSIIMDETNYVEHDRYLDMSDIIVNVNGFYDAKTTELIVGLDLECTVVVPCAISLEPIEIDIMTQFSESFVFENNHLLEEDEDLILIEESYVDLWPYIWSAVMAQIPIKVIDPELEEYPSGKGWQVLSEDGYIKQQEDKIDPRLEKLKDFKFD